MKQKLKITVSRAERPCFAERVKFLLFGKLPKLTIVISQAYSDED